MYSSGQLEVTVDFLVEIDKLVQLIESPIFTCKFIDFAVLNTEKLRFAIQVEAEQLYSVIIFDFHKSRLKT